jgi:D-apionolactonase
VHNGTCPIVHAADDRSVMETHEALPYQVTTARSFIGNTPYRIGPSSIGCRDNPHGKTYTPNPNNERVCLVKSDPRQRGLFGAAWTLGYVASLAPTGVEAISFGAPTGPLGIIDGTHAAVVPAYHVVAGLTRAAGARRVAASSSDEARVRCIAYRTQRATLLWIANLSARDQNVKVAHAGADAWGIVLDENSFAQATAWPAEFQAALRPIDTARLKLRAYAVALLCINDS